MFQHIWHPKSGAEWAATVILCGVACLIVGVPVLRILSLTCNITTVRIEDDMLVIATSPIGRFWERRISLAEVVGIESTDESSGKNDRIYRLLARRSDGSTVKILSCGGGSRLAGQTRVRTMLEAWVNRRPGHLKKHEEWGASQASNGKQMGLGMSIVVTIFLSLFAAAGVMILGMGCWNLGAREMWHHDWPVVQAVVIDQKTKAPDGKRDTAYQAQITCRHQWEGHSYQVVLTDDSSSDIHTATALLRDHPMGSTVLVRVNPQGLDQGELPGVNLKRGLMLLGAGVLFALISLAVIFGIWKQRSKAKVKTKAAQLNAPPNKQRMGWGAGVVLLSVFSGPGALVLYLCMGRPLLNMSRSSDWQQIPCVIESSQVREHSGEDTTYSPDIVYQYEWQGQNHRANRADFVDGSDSTNGAAETVAAHPAGQKTICFVNPADPSEAVLARVWFARGQWIGVLVGGIFFLVGVGLAGRVILGWRPEWRGRADQRSTDF